MHIDIIEVLEAFTEHERIVDQCKGGIKVYSTMKPGFNIFDENDRLLGYVLIDFRAELLEVGINTIQCNTETHAYTKLTDKLKGLRISKIKLIRDSGLWNFGSNRTDFSESN